MNRSFAEKIKDQLIEHRLNNVFVYDYSIGVDYHFCITDGVNIDIHLRRNFNAYSIQYIANLVDDPEISIIALTSQGDKIIPKLKF